MNSTLKDNQCPAHSEKPSQDAQAAWLSIFAPNITQRLNSYAPGSTLVDADIPPLMSLCSFESLFHHKTSPWCGIFTKEEWAAYEYYTDLEKFYYTGYAFLENAPLWFFLKSLLIHYTAPETHSVAHKASVGSTSSSRASQLPQSMTRHRQITHSIQILPHFL